MSDNKKVEVISNCKASVLVNVPHLHLRKEWNRKGAKVLIDLEILSEAMYEPGVEYMFKQGILYINDMAAKIELGLEAPDAIEPENIIILTDAQKEEYMSSAKQGWELKKVLETLSYEGKKDFCDYVLDHELLDSKKAAIIKEVCNFDVLRAIQMKHANED